MLHSLIGVGLRFGVLASLVLLLFPSFLWAQANGQDVDKTSAITSFGLVPVDQISTTVEGIERNWMGQYLVSQSRPVPDPRDPSGRRWEAGSAIPTIETDRIPARLGVRFGLGFTVRGAPVGQPIEIRRVWRFPPVTNPETGATTTRSANVIQCRIGEPLYVGQFLAESYELIPGIWTVEIWFGEKKLFEQDFTLYRPEN